MKTLVFLLLIANILFYAWLNHWLLWLPWQPAQFTPVTTTYAQSNEQTIFLVQEKEKTSTSTSTISKLADPENLLADSNANSHTQQKEDSDLADNTFISSAEMPDDTSTDELTDSSSAPSQGETTAGQSEQPSELTQSEEQPPDAAMGETEIIMVNETDLPTEESHEAETEKALQQQDESKQIASTGSPIENFLPQQSEKTTPDQEMNAVQQTQSSAYSPQRSLQDQDDTPTQKEQVKTSQTEIETPSVDNSANAVDNKTNTASAQTSNKTQTNTLNPMDAMGTKMADNQSSSQTPSDSPDQNPYLCFRNGPFSQNAAVQKRAKWWQQHNAEVNIQAQQFKTQLTRIYLPPLPTRQQAEQLVQRLRNQEITDTEISTQPALRHAIFVGTYRDPLHADHRIQELQRKGYNDIRTQGYLKNDTKYWLNVRIPATKAELLNHYRKRFPAVSLTSTSVRCALNNHFE